MINLPPLWDASLLPRSRVHAIPMASETQNRVFLKREDEVGYALSGGKMRKFAGLIPYLKSENFQEVVVIGGSHSNQVLAAAQLLLQAGIDFQLFLKEGHHTGPGNSFLIEMLVPQSEWTTIGGEAWPEVESLAMDYANSQEEKTFVLPEGGWCPQALGGTFSLGSEVMEEGNYQHVLMEAGTGLSALGLLISLAQYESPPTLHILLMAMDEAAFEERLATALAWTEKYFPEWVPQELPPFHTHRPRNAKAFGAVNTTLIQSILMTARRYGILTDPIYSGKLFAEAEHLIEEIPLSGDLLIIHSGGQSSLPGFYSRFSSHL